MTPAFSTPARARLARLLAPVSRVRGVQRVANRIAGSHGTFTARVADVNFAGDLASYVDRQALLFGGYERQMIDLFVSQVPRGGTVLDIGANVGNHALLFSRHFDRVIAFEPNPRVLPALRRNLALNPDRRIELRPIGLSDEAAELDFYDTDTANKGMGTFLPMEQYDVPLARTATAAVRVGDEEVGDERVAAIKLDVQGFEPAVLRGLSRTLRRDRPPVWCELGAGTLDQMDSADAISALFGYPVRLDKMTERGRWLNQLVLEPVGSGTLPQGNYLIRPR